MPELVDSAPPSRKRARRILPDFARLGEFTIEDAKGYSVSLVNARILLQELPLFGDHEGDCFFEPWPDDRWRQGWGAQGEAGMCDLAVAATYAFVRAVTLPLASTACSSEPSTHQFVPSMDGAEFIKSDVCKAQLPSVLVTACAAIQDIILRTACEEAAEEEIRECAAANMSDFCWMLAVNLAKTTPNIVAVKQHIDAAFAESLIDYGTNADA